MRRLLNRFASWLKFRTCAHAWLRYDAQVRVATSDDVEIRFRCPQCEGVRVKLIPQAEWREQRHNAMMNALHELEESRL
jgi:hypothetical protein